MAQHAARPQARPSTAPAPVSIVGKRVRAVASESWDDDFLWQNSSASDIHLPSTARTGTSNAHTRRRTRPKSSVASTSSSISMSAFGGDLPAEAMFAAKSWQSSVPDLGVLDGVNIPEDDNDPTITLSSVIQARNQPSPRKPRLSPARRHTMTATSQSANAKGPYVSGDIEVNTSPIRKISNGRAALAPESHGFHDDNVETLTRRNSNMNSRLLSPASSSMLTAFGTSPASTSMLTWRSQTSSLTRSDRDVFSNSLQSGPGSDVETDKEMDNNYALHHDGIDDWDTEFGASNISFPGSADVSIGESSGTPRSSGFSLFRRSSAIHGKKLSISLRKSFSSKPNQPSMVASGAIDSPSSSSSVVRLKVTLASLRASLSFRQPSISASTGITASASTATITPAKQSEQDNDKDFSGQERHRSETVGSATISHSSTARRLIRKPPAQQSPPADLHTSGTVKQSLSRHVSHTDNVYDSSSSSWIDSPQPHPVSTFQPDMYPCSSDTLSQSTVRRRRSLWTSISQGARSLRAQLQPDQQDSASACREATLDEHAGATSHNLEAADFQSEVFSPRPSSSNRSSISSAVSQAWNSRFSPSVPFPSPERRVSTASSRSSQAEISGNQQTESQQRPARRPLSFTEFLNRSFSMSQNRFQDAASSEAKISETSISQSQLGPIIISHRATASGSNIPSARTLLSELNRPSQQPVRSRTGGSVGQTRYSGQSLQTEPNQRPESSMSLLSQTSTVRPSFRTGPVLAPAFRFGGLPNSAASKPDKPPSAWKLRPMYNPTQAPQGRNTRSGHSPNLSLSLLPGMSNFSATSPRTIDNDGEQDQVILTTSHQHEIRSACAVAENSGYFARAQAEDTRQSISPGSRSLNSSTSGSLSRRVSLSDLRIPLRISQAQRKVGKDLLRLRQFKTGVEELKSLRRTYKALTASPRHYLVTGSSAFDMDLSQQQLPSETAEKLEMLMLRLKAEYATWWEIADVLINLADGADEDAVGPRTPRNASHEPVNSTAEPGQPSEVRLSGRGAVPGEADFDVPSNGAGRQNPEYESGGRRLNLLRGMLQQPQFNPEPDIAAVRLHASSISQLRQTHTDADRAPFISLPFKQGPAAGPSINEGVPGMLSTMSSAVLDGRLRQASRASYLTIKEFVKSLTQSTGNHAKSHASSPTRSFRPVAAPMRRIQSDSPTTQSCHMRMSVSGETLHLHSKRTQRSPASEADSSEEEDWSGNEDDPSERISRSDTAATVLASTQINDARRSGLADTRNANPQSTMELPLGGGWPDGSKLILTPEAMPLLLAKVSEVKARCAACVSDLRNITV